MLCSGSITGASAKVINEGLTEGTHAIKAVYGGNSNYKSDSATVTQTVTQAGPTVTLSSNLNPSTFGQNVTFKAKVDNASQTPTGSVRFYDGTTSLGSAALTGDSAQVVVGSLGAGGHTVKAVYSGDSDFKSDSTTIIQAVSQASPTVV